MNYPKRFLLSLVIISLSGICCLTACHSEKKNHTYIDVPDSNIIHGRELAAVYCQSCHTLPDPSLADARSWFEGILPQMGPRLGIFRYHFKNYPSNKFEKNMPKDFYPSKPLLTDTEWQYIIDYYCSVSPDSLPGQEKPEPIQKTLPFFRLSKPVAAFFEPATSYVHIEPPGSIASFSTADALRSRIARYDSISGMKDSLVMGGPVVDRITESAGRWIYCNIGVLNPNDGKFGKLIAVSLDKNGKMTAPKIVFDSLMRPVKVVASDLNGDGKEDLVVCEFGNMIGALSWLEKKTDSGYTRHVIKAVPGAISAIINDYNKDGLPDIWCLFSQGNENISLFTNQGGGRFTETQLIRFPPIYGSSSFELDDFNHDGFPDILYTCGDNADYSAVFKPYHGVYIFLNDGHNHFTQKVFFPVNGCYKAMANDFDGDGDLDIAAISFFPDFVNQPEESFVYLENEGGLSFKPYSFPGAAEGRWITMDIGDADGDGRPDIMLANFSIAPAFIHQHPDWKTKPPFVILYNQYPKKTSP